MRQRQGTAYTDFRNKGYLLCLIREMLLPMQECRRPGFDPGVGKIPWRRNCQPTLVFLPGKSHGQRSLAGYNLCSGKELDPTKWLSLSMSRIREMTFHMRSCVRMMNWVRASQALASESQSQAKGSNCSHFCIPHPMTCFPCSLLQSTSLELIESKQMTWPRRHVTREVSSPLYAGTEHQTKQVN